MVARAESLPENEDLYEQACDRHMIALGWVVQDDVLYSVQLMLGEFDRRDWHDDFEDEIELALGDLWRCDPDAAQAWIYGSGDETTLRVTLAEFEDLDPHEAAAQLTMSLCCQMSDRLHG